jgi:hypothetical protein
VPATYCHTKRISPKTLNRLFKDRKRRLPVDNSQHASQLPEQSSSDAPAVNGEASLSLQTGRLAPETGDVQRSVDVPMMFGTAIAAHPAPDPKTFQPSRAADASTRRTGSGCIRFIDFQIGHPRVIAFVSEVAPQHRPSGIEHALCHPGPCQLGSRHVSDTFPTVIRRHWLISRRENLCRKSFRRLAILAWIVLTRRLRCASASFGSRSR